MNGAEKIIYFSYHFDLSFYVYLTLTLIISSKITRTSIGLSAVWILLILLFLSIQIFLLYTSFGTIIIIQNCSLVTVLALLNVQRAGLTWTGPAADSVHICVVHSVPCNMTCCVGPSSGDMEECCKPQIAVGISRRYVSHGSINLEIAGCRKPFPAHGFDICL